LNRSPWRGVRHRHEDQLRHAQLSFSRLDTRTSGDEIEHSSIVCEHVSAEPEAGSRRRSLEDLLEESRAETSVLPAVLYDERDLDGVSLAGRVVSAHGDEHPLAARVRFDDQRKALPVVHGREIPRPVGRQPLHDREEPLIHGIAAQAAVELLQAWRIVRTDRSDAVRRHHP